jgi:hypothetical protein
LLQQVSFLIYNVLINNSKFLRQILLPCRLKSVQLIIRGAIVFALEIWNC